jgi:enediyne biosynthesis protein E4
MHPGRCLPPTSLSTLTALVLLAVACEPVGPDSSFGSGPAVGPDDPPSVGFVPLSFVEEGVERGLDTVLDDPEPYEELAPDGEGGQMLARDLDGDGDVDLIFLSFYDSPLVYRNDGDGNFDRAAPLLDIDPETGPFNAISAADLDGDGLPELLLAGDEHVFRYPSVGELVWGPPETILERPVVVKRRLRALALGDAEGDGDVDLLVAVDDYEGTPSLLLLNSGDGLRSPVVVELPGTPTALTAFFLDVDLDGSTEILIPSTGPRPSLVFYLVGDPALTDSWEDRADTAGLPMHLETMGFDTADIDVDGLPDLVLTDTGPPRLMLSAGGGPYVEAGAAQGLTEGDTVSVGWSISLADLDNDGDLDLAQASGASHLAEDLNGEPPPPYPDLVWLREDGRYVESAEELNYGDSGDNIGLVTADVNGDGSLDVVVAGPTAFPRLHMNQANGGSWLRVRLVGPPGNPDGFGARVGVDAVGSRWTRALHGGRAAIQGPATLHFGLGQAEHAEAVTVLWPDGAVTELLDVELPGSVEVHWADAD